MTKLVEIWKPIKDYEGYYEVSNLGNVRSVKRQIRCHTNSVRTIHGVSRKIFTDLNGYKTVSISNAKKGKTKIRKVHVLVAEAFIPNPDNKPQINHIDGNKANNIITNLEWCTGSENMKHAYCNELVNVAKGERSPNSIFTNEQVLFIFNSSENVYDLAKRFNAKVRTIYAIKEGQNWGHLTGKKYERIPRQ